MSETHVPEDSHPPEEPSVRNDLWRLSFFVLTILFGIYAFGLYEHHLSLLDYPRAVDYGETPEIARAWTIRNGGNIFTDWNSLPLTVSNYTPLYSTINAIFIRFTGPVPYTGRLISMLSCLVSAVLLVKLVWSQGRTVALLAGGVFLSSHIIWMWSGLVRVDNLALMFQLSALVFAYEGLKGELKQKWVWASMACCVLAAFTRQTMIVAFIALIYTLLYRDKRLTRNVVLTFCSISGFVLGLMILMTDGWAWKHMVVSNVNEYSTQLLRIYMRPVWALNHWMLPLIVWGFWHIRKQRLLFSYCVGAVLTVFLIGKIGSSVNYLLEAWVAACVLLAHCLGKLSSRHWSGWAVVVLIFMGWLQMAHAPYSKQGGELKSTGFWNGLLSFQRYVPLWRLNPFGHEPGIATSSRYYVPDPSPAELLELMAVEERLLETEGPIFSSDLQFLLSLDKEISVQPFVVTQLTKGGVIDAQAWYNCLRRKCFGAIVLDHSLEEAEQAPTGVGWHLTPRSVIIMRDEYMPHMYNPTGKYWIYLPKTKP